MSVPTGSIVAVTGAAGFVGSWCVKVLLDNGYHVRACVRSIKDHSRVEFLQTLTEHNKLTMHSCDLTVPGAFDAVFDGCDGVVHTAAGIWSGPTNIEDQGVMYGEMMHGIELFIDSVNKAQSVRRVIFTSSLAAMLDASTRLIERNPVVDEQRYPDLTDKLAMQRAIFGYPSAKVESERRLVEASTKSGRWDVAMVNPGEVIGPILSPHQLYGWAARVAEISAGVEQIHQPNHRPLIPVDVRDVADAHFRLLEASWVNGSRFLAVSTDKVYFSDIGRYLKEALPDLQGAAVSCKPGYLGKLSAIQAELLWSRFQVRNDAIRQATGMTFRSLLDTLRDNVSSVRSLCGELSSTSPAARFGDSLARPKL